MKHWGHPRLVGSQSQQNLRDPALEQCGSMGCSEVGRHPESDFWQTSLQKQWMLMFGCLVFGLFSEGIFTEFFQNGFLLQVVDLECVIIMNMSDVLPPLFFLEDFSNGPAAVPIWLKSWKSSLLFLCFLSGTAMYLWILLQGSGSSISGLSGNGTQKLTSECFLLKPSEQIIKTPGCLGYNRGWNRKPSYMGIISYKTNWVSIQDPY